MLFKQQAATGSYCAAEASTHTCMRTNAIYALTVRLHPGVLLQYLSPPFPGAVFLQLQPPIVQQRPPASALDSASTFMLGSRLKMSCAAHTTQGMTYHRGCVRPKTISMV